MTFTPTAGTLQPADSTLYVKYKLKTKRLNELIFKNTYTIQVSALRTRSSVSNNFDTCLNIY